MLSSGLDRGCQEGVSDADAEMDRVQSTPRRNLEKYIPQMYARLNFTSWPVFSRYSEEEPSRNYSY
jgi:hypothetical protein